MSFNKNNNQYLDIIAGPIMIAGGIFIYETKPIILFLLYPLFLIFGIFLFTKGIINIRRQKLNISQPQSKILNIATKTTGAVLAILTILGIALVVFIFWFFLNLIA